MEYSEGQDGRCDRLDEIADSAATKDPTIYSRGLCQPFPNYDATCANPLQSKVIP